MGGKSTGDDRNEKTIRYLLKLPQNRRCINCNSLGPQYVCTTFWTFICTNCSGVHREFTHRVKSVSMAKFSDEEVNALQAGGNERARETYLKTWDYGCNTLPRNSDTNKLREFIKHVYEDRRYTGDINGFSGSTLSEKDDPYKYKFSEKHTTSKRKDNQNDRLSSEGRYSLKEKTRHGNNPNKLEDVDDRNHRFPRRAATEMFTTADLAQDKCSTIHHDSSMPNIPMLRSIKEILGENAPMLRVEKQPQVGSLDTSTTINEKVVSPKEEVCNLEVASKYGSTSSESLIDFTRQSNAPLDSSGDRGDENEVAPQVPYSNTLEYLLFQLAPPVESSCENNSPIATSLTDIIPSTSNELALYDQDMNSNTPPNSLPIHLLDNNIPTPSNAALEPSKTIEVVSNSPFLSTIQESVDPISILSSSNEVRESERSFIIAFPTPHDLCNSQQCGGLALVPTSSRSSLAQPINSSEVVKNQIETLNHNGQEFQGNSVRQLTNFARGEIKDVANLSSSMQPNFAQSNPIQRKEIPYDLFNTFSSSRLSAPFPMRQNVPYNNMGDSMQYQYQYSSPFKQGPMTFVGPSLSINPFDMNNQLGQPNTYTSMTSIQGSLSNIMPNPQSTYMGQNLYNTPPSRGAMGSLGPINTNQQPTYKQFGPMNPSPPPSKAGNPFI
ncbi:hypothetical protein V2J09_004723 [Rumex salicifolius]